MTLIEFTAIMESKLSENESKDGWTNEWFSYLLDRVREELKELEKAVNEDCPPQEIAREAADVANFCYMVADVAERGGGE